jgi:hypothetical protein
MDGPHAVLDHGCSPSVVVNDLVVFRAGNRPTETKVELIVLTRGMDLVPETCALRSV